MKALRLNLFLESAALMTGVANAEENSSVSLPYIPGGAIRGAAIGEYLRRRPSAGDLASDEDARALFFDEQVFFLNAYPAFPLDANHRALPVPRSWHAEKDQVINDDYDVYDFALYDKPERVDKPKTEKKPFFWQVAEERDIPLATPKSRGTVHNGSIAPMEKSTDNSNVFRYVALEAGQRFVAYVLSEDEALLQTLRDECLPDGLVRLGGSKTAGYGLIRLQCGRPADWVGEYEATQPDGWTVITLLSDALLVTGDGQATTDLHDYLKRALNRPALPQPDVYAHTRLVGGFNRKWGLPLPQAWALGMGSVFAYKASELSPDDLAAVIQSGIGLRREEGFGRVGVNVSARAAFRSFSPIVAHPTQATLSESSARLADRMARRRLIESAVAAIPKYTQLLRFPGQPENAQLSQLRVVTAQARRERNLKLITDHLGRLKSRSREQFSRRHLRVGDRQPITWETWLETRATKADALEQINDALEQINIDPARFAVAGQIPVADDALNSDITCLLIDAVLRKAIKGKQAGG